MTAVTATAPTAAYAESAAVKTAEAAAEASCIAAEAAWSNYVNAAANGSVWMPALYAVYVAAEVNCRALKLALAALKATETSNNSAADREYKSALRYYTGKSQNLSGAVLGFDKAAKLGNWEAAIILKTIYSYGAQDIPADPAKAAGYAAIADRLAAAQYCPMRNVSILEPEINGPLGGTAAGAWLNTHNFGKPPAAAPGNGGSTAPDLHARDLEKVLRMPHK